MKKKISITHLLRPHWVMLGIAFIAVLGETATDLLEPWPLKIVFDYVLGPKKMPDWLGGLVSSAPGHGRIAVLNFAVVSVVIIAFHLVPALDTLASDRRLKNAFVLIF